MASSDRLIEPIQGARSGNLHEDISENAKLDAVTNTTLSNIINKLSSLLSNSEKLLVDLAREVVSLSERASSLQSLTGRFAIITAQLDSTIALIPSQNIHHRKSSNISDHQIIGTATIDANEVRSYIERNQ